MGSEKVRSEAEDGVCWKSWAGRREDGRRGWFGQDEVEGLERFGGGQDGVREDLR